MAYGGEFDNFPELETYEIENEIEWRSEDIEERKLTTYHGDQYLQDDWSHLTALEECLEERLKETEQTS
jgi:hypothetical protein